ncbi:hypothetical protein FPQ18DRAFT_342953 [Pyronema domesticum]|nr:hypothetical protein FPQ18DRAFT_342953 [Pyronema domesticum]
MFLPQRQRLDADVSATDFEGRTPLHRAMKDRYETVARLLIERGADVPATDEYGQAPLQVQASGNRE